MDYTAGQVMDLSASLLNDSNKSFFTYDFQLPFLKIADDELLLEILGNNGTIYNQVCNIAVPAGDLFLALPCNFFLPIKLEERVSTSTNDDDFVDMTEKGWEPATKQTNTLVYWSFRNNKVNFVGSTVARTVRLSYKKTLQTLVDSSIVEHVAKAKNFLAFRTAALCAWTLGNKDKSNDLNTQAVIDLDKLTSVLVKNGQGVRTRRKPFRVPYYRRVG